MSFLTGCASLNFWCFGEYNWRLALDKTVAYSTCICYYYVAVHQVMKKLKEGSLIFSYVCVTLLIAKALSKSYEKWGKCCSTWVFYHMMFHLMVVVGQLLVIRETRVSP